MLYMARFGYRRGKGNFAKTFGRDVDGNTKAPTIADAAQGLTDRADQNFERFDDEVGQSVLGDLLLAWCLENRKHSEGHHEQVQRIYPTHYLASWVDLPKMAVNLRGVPELLTVLLADQNDGEWLQHGGKGGFPLAVSHQDNSLLNLFGRHVSIRGQHASDLTSDTFVDESADDIGIDELLVIRLAQACESAPLRVQGAQGIENRHPLAKRAANAFRKDLAVFIEVYGRSVPRQAFLQMWEVGVALGMTNILLSTARLLNDWEHDGRVTGTSRQEAWPLFADASQGQDKALRDLSEASMTECLRRYEQLPVTMMILRVLGERVPKDRKLGGSLPNLLPDSTAFIDLLGEIYHESHERSDALLDKFHEDCLDLAQVLEEEAEEPLIVEQLKDGTTNPIRRLSEALVVLMGDKLQRSKFLTALDIALMTDQPNYPSFLPGLKPDETFVFADTLGFHAVAMVPVDDTEPKATVAVLGRLLGGDESTAPSVGKSAAQALSEEMHRYLQLHPDYRRIRVHALRAGDAMPVARALGQTLKRAEEQDENAQDRDRQLCYDLDLYSDSGQSDAQSGRFLATTAERRRSGAGAVPEQDRWLLESVTRPGGVSLPRLRWARRTESKPHSAAHVSIAFDVFTSRVECRKQADLPEAGVLEAHGLMLMPSRIFAPEPTPHWLSFVPAKPDGEKHPVTAILTRRQINLHAKILQATARHLGGGVDDWPVLVTEVSPAQAKLLQDLHGLADWVITADRNAGIEYFDSPKDLPKVYESYIIDCVPERDDLGFMQMITSTASFDEVVRLLDDALGEMGLSASPRNCQYLLSSLKAISGRLALRLAGTGNSAQEMVALALAHKHCVDAAPDDQVWPPLSEGFLIPLDDIPDLFRKPGKSTDGSGQRADLLYIRAGRRGGLQVVVVEVKFRRYLKTARASDLAKGIEAQIDATCRRWQELFGSQASELEQTVNRAWLARILRFYARKGRRHGLSKDGFEHAMREINRMVRKDSDLPQGLGRIGFVFCPEYGGQQPGLIEHEGESELWLFGSDILPEPRVDLPSRGPSPSLPIKTDPITSLEDNPAEHDLPNTEQLTGTTHDMPEGVVANEELSKGSSSFAPQNRGIETPRSEEPTVLLGHRDAGDAPLRWHPSIRSNPHLMILGLPGMGKTTILINICLQLKNQGITPVVFSYHEDIDEKLSAHLPEPPMVVRFAGLGFNPMEVVGESSLAYLDNVGMLRDIFSAIFPDLGDVQLGRLREALKQSYQEAGWSPGQRGDTPEFRDFLDRLRSEDKPDKGLLVRLSELDDYGLFTAGGAAPTLLGETRLSLVEIHGTQNDALQRAFATFVLHNLYQNMFRRGTQDQITHAIIFDEAHRAAKLKLIPTMVKECRKYGIAFVVASQEAKDFDPSLFTAVANYLALRLNEADAKLMAKSFAATGKVSVYADRIKQMPKYRAMYYGEGLRAPVRIALAQY